MKSEDFEVLMRTIGQEIGCDKVLSHSYETAYSRVLADLSDKPLRILEIGIGGEDYSPGGQGLSLWGKLFPNATILGIDIYDKSALDTDRVKTFIVDQGDTGSLESFAKKNGPFDLVIDDGSHFRSDVLTSLFTLSPFINDGGFYVIEDISTSYWPVYGGSTIANGFLDTPLNWIKRSIDTVNKGDHLWSLPNVPAWNLLSVQVFSGIAFLGFGQPRVAQNYPTGNGSDFEANQKAVDRANYGGLASAIEEFNLDPLRAITRAVSKNS